MMADRFEDVTKSRSRSRRKDVIIVEVSPRDGLQNEKEIVPVELKEKFIRKLMESGVDEIEVGSFVSPKVVPQMKDTDELFLRIEKNGIRVKFSALVPNLRGFERVMNLPADKRPEKIAVFTAASETFNRRNIGMTIEESLRVFKDVIMEAKRNRFEVRAYISTAFWCPFEGKIPPVRVIKICEELFSLGADEISIADTIGRASPSDTRELLSDIAKSFDVSKIAMHFHATYGMAITDAFVSYEEFGVRRFDSSAGGLGGCPFAPGARGNIATEDLVFAFESSGIKTGVDIKKIIDAVSCLQIHPRSSISQIEKIIMYDAS